MEAGAGSVKEAGDKGASSEESLAEDTEGAKALRLPRTQGVLYKGKHVKRGTENRMGNIETGGRGEGCESG